MENKLINSKNLAIVLIILIIIAIIGIVTIVIVNSRINNQSSQKEDPITARRDKSLPLASNAEPLERTTQSQKITLSGCPIEEQIFTVRGNSLVPLVNPGDKIKILFDYYNCNDIKVNDVVAYNFTGNADPIIKIIKAIPGDKWGIKKVNTNYEIIVNNNLLKNSTDEIYLIPEDSIKMLRLYATDYPIIPKDTYLILGNQTNGTIDSSKFGLISKQDIYGKVEVIK